MLFLQETHINTNSTETIEGFCFIYSTSITDAQRKQADKTRAENTARGRQRNGVRHAPPIDIEHGGTGVILSPKAKATLLDFKQIDGRIMTVTLDMIGPPLHFLNAYAPQSGTETRLKNDFYETLERNLVSFPNSHPTFIVGDFNAAHNHTDSSHKPFVHISTFSSLSTPKKNMVDPFSLKHLFIHWVDNPQKPWFARTLLQYSHPCITRKHVFS